MTEVEIREELQRQEAQKTALKASIDELDAGIKNAPSPYTKDTFRSEWTNQQVEYVTLLKEIESLKK